MNDLADKLLTSWLPGLFVCLLHGWLVNWTVFNYCKGKCVPCVSLVVKSSVA